MTMKRNAILVILTASVLSATLFGCIDDIIPSADGCKYEDDGQGGMVETPASNPCPLSMNDPAYGILELSDLTSVLQFDVDSMVRFIETNLNNGAVKGWQLAIGYDNKIIRTAAGGVRSGPTDCPADFPMTACQKTRIGSQTKNIVCTAVVMCLQEMGKSPFETLISEYVPEDWDTPEGVDTLTIAHFLGHRNGFGSDSENANWSSIKTWYENGINGTVGDYGYMNGNYNIMRIIFPRIYGEAYNVTYTEEEIDTDEECSAIEIGYIYSNIFNPLGNYDDFMNWVDDGSKVYSFSSINDQVGEAVEFTNLGAGTMIVSAPNMVKYYMELFDGGSVIDPAIIDTMNFNDWPLGFNRLLNNGPLTIAPFNAPYYGHGGTIRDYYSSTIYLPGGLVVSLAVNSCFTDNGLVDNTCSSWGTTEIINDAYRAAFL